MTPACVALLASLWATPSSIPRTVNTAIAIAEAASETDSPKYYVAILDVWVGGAP